MKTGMSKSALRAKTIEINPIAILQHSLVAYPQTFLNDWDCYSDDLWAGFGASFLAGCLAFSGSAKVTFLAVSAPEFNAFSGMICDAF